MPDPFRLIETPVLISNADIKAAEFRRDRRPVLSEIFSPSDAVTDLKHATKKNQKVPAPTLQELENLLRGDPRLRRKIREIYLRLVPETTKISTGCKARGPVNRSTQESLSDLTQCDRRAHKRIHFQTP
jgi:hypothetical protein